MTDPTRVPLTPVQISGGVVRLLPPASDVEFWRGVDCEGYIGTIAALDVGACECEGRCECPDQ